MTKARSIFNILGRLSDIVAEAEEKAIAEAQGIRRQIIALPLTPADRVYYLTGFDEVPRDRHLRRTVDMLLAEATEVARLHPERAGQ